LDATVNEVVYRSLKEAKVVFTSWHGFEKKNDSWTKPTTVRWRPRAINISQEIDILASILSTWSQ
jgi:hypothetical protein